MVNKPKKLIVRCGVRTHALSRVPELKSGALDHSANLTWWHEGVPIQNSSHQYCFILCNMFFTFPIPFSLSQSWNFTQMKTRNKNERNDLDYFCIVFCLEHEKSRHMSTARTKQMICLHKMGGGGCNSTSLVLHFTTLWYVEQNCWGVELRKLLSIRIRERRGDVVNWGWEKRNWDIST